MRRLLTEAGERLPEIPWAEDYPRPLLRRADWLCLNGVWSLTFGGQTREIRVPFCPESLLSGVETPPRPGAELRYRRFFVLPASWQGRQILSWRDRRRRRSCFTGLFNGSMKTLPFR